MLAIACGPDTMKMIKTVLLSVLALIFCIAPVARAENRVGAPATPDPFVLNDKIIGALGAFYRQTDGVTPRQVTIDPSKKTLVLLIGGQSQATTLQQTLYTPSNSAVVSYMNIFDGAFYPVTGPLLGTNWIPTGSPYGNGNLTVRLADKLIARGWDQVLMVNFAVGNTEVADWSVGGALYERSTVAMKRLAAKGITPSTTGVTFGFLFMQGESDNLNGTSQATYSAKLQEVFDKLDASGFVGRKFMPLETWISGSGTPTIRAAQAAAVDNVKVWSGGDLDALGSTARFADLVHFNDTGAPLAATAIESAMHASGAPY